MSLVSKGVGGIGISRYLIGTYSGATASLFNFKPQKNNLIDKGVMCVRIVIAVLVEC